MKIQVLPRPLYLPGAAIALLEQACESRLVNADEGELGGDEEAVGGYQQENRQQSPNDLYRRHLVFGHQKKWPRHSGQGEIELRALSCFPR